MDGGVEGMGGTAYRVVVADARSHARRRVSGFLRRMGLSVVPASSHLDMAEAMARGRADIVVADATVLGAADVKRLKGVRALCSAPLICICEDGDDLGRALVLEAGAEDCVARSVHPRELRLRVRNALARRGRPPAREAGPPGVETDPSAVLQRAQWRLDRRSRTVSCGRTVLPLTTGEFDLFDAFMANPDRVLSRDHLMRSVKGRDWSPYDRSIDAMISRLRKKIEADPHSPRHIRTVRHRGYVFAPSPGEPV